MGRVFTPDIRAQSRVLPRRGVARPRPPLPLRRNIEFQPPRPLPSAPPVGRVFTPDIGAQSRVLPRRGVARPRPPLPHRRNIEFQPPRPQPQLIPRGGGGKDDMGGVVRSDEIAKLTML